MFAYDRQHGGGRRSGPGSVLAVVSQDRHVSRRVSIFDLVTSPVGKRRPDASKEEEPSRGFVGRDHAKHRGRLTEEGFWGRRFVVGRIHRPARVREGGGKPPSARPA